MSVLLNRNSVWNDKVKIKDMDLSHIVRTIKMLRSYAKDRTKNGVNGYDTFAFGQKIHNWIHIMQLEVDRRIGKR